MATPSKNWMPAHETAIMVRPPASAVVRPIRSMKAPTKRTSAYMPSDVRPDDREDQVLRVMAVDDHVAGQVHHRDHHAHRCESGQQRGNHSGPADDLAQRGGRRGRPAGRRRRSARRCAWDPADAEGESHRDEREDSAPSHGIVRTLALSSSRPAKIGLKTVAEDGAEDGADEDVGDPAGAPRGRIHVAGGGLHEQGDPGRRPDQRKPATTASAESAQVPSAVSQQPTAPSANPEAITGRGRSGPSSGRRGTAVRADAVRKIAGPSPSRLSMPVTSTNVSEATAAPAGARPS